MPSWSLCIATLNRHDVLLSALGNALRQTRPPGQIVIVDASDTWQDTKQAVAEMMAGSAQIELCYVPAEERSSATQRNQGISLCTQDIVFMLDDDSFMHPTCAEELLRIYEADSEAALAGVAAALVGEIPKESKLEQLDQKPSLRPKFRETVLKTKLGRWLVRKVLLQNMEELFLRYDGPRQGELPDAVKACGAIPCSFMPGCAISVRREVALAEPFDVSLRFYAAFEDLDVTYRYAKHGMLAQSQNAHLHHFEAAAGRIKRKTVMIFQLLNMVVFLKRHATQPERFKGRYQILLWRRLLGEVLKDSLSGRFDLPQARGVWLAMGLWRKLWDLPTEQIDDWYPKYQRSILDNRL